MDINLLSHQYEVKKILDRDIPEVLNLCAGNPLYYKHCPPSVSIEQIRADLMALPPNKTYEDKHYVGFYSNKELIAVMDLICRYPNDETVFIGFFMTNKKIQGSGIGTNIITECLQSLKLMGYKRVRLGYVKDNPQPKKFWEKNNFKLTGVEDIQKNYTVVVMEKIL